MAAGGGRANGRAVVLLSGGVDSSALLRLVCRRHGVRNTLAITFRYGQKHARETACAARQARAAGVAAHRVVDARFFAALASASALTAPGRAVPRLSDISAAQRDQPPTYVPNRNLALLSLAAAWAESAGARVVYYGAQQQDRYGYWDCTPEFVRRLNRVLALNRRRPVRVEAPFARWSKARVVRFGLEVGVDFAHTWTCYRGGRRPCELCPSCVERAAAFRAAGTSDPLAAAAAGGRARKPRRSTTRSVA